MSQLKLSGDASGTGIVTVAAPNTNSTYTVTLPAAAGTIVTGAAGSDTQVQFNDSGSFGGDAGLTYNKTTDVLTVAGSFNGPHNGTVGATTPNTGAFTTLSATGNTTLGDAVGDTLTVNATATFNNADATIYGVRVGRGAGAVSTNTAVGVSALAANSTGSLNTAVGWQALLDNTTASGSTAVGYRSLENSTASANTAVGDRALVSNTTGADNTAVGTQALTENTTASYNTAVGYQALYASNRTADTNGYNTAIGYGSGSAITTGQKNTIIGAYTGNQGNLDIRTANNYIVLSDGGGNPRVAVDDNGAVRLMTSNGLGNGIAINSKYYNGVANNGTVAATLTNNGNYTNFIIEIEWVSKNASANAVSYFSTKRYISIQGGAVSVNTTINTDLTSNASLSVTASTNTITFTITNTAGSTVYGTLSVFVRGTGTDGLTTTRTTIAFS